MTDFMFPIAYSFLTHRLLCRSQGEWATLRAAGAMSRESRLLPSAHARYSRPECEVPRAWEGSSVHPHPAYSTAETRLFWRVRLSSMWCVLVSLQMLLKLKGETEWSQHFTQETVHLLTGIHCSRLSSKGCLEVAFWVGSYSGHILT